MPVDYRKVVLDAYKKKKVEMSLVPNLLDPTPGNLRAECLIVCRERYTPKDHEVLRLFFNGGDKEKYIRSIENTPAEKLKQMSRILKGADVQNPGLKYFELLEWLMDLNIGTSTTYYKSFNNPSPISVGAIDDEMGREHKLPSSTAKQEKQNLITNTSGSITVSDGGEQVSDEIKNVEKIDNNEAQKNDDVQTTSTHVVGVGKIKELILKALSGAGVLKLKVIIPLVAVFLIGMGVYVFWVDKANRAINTLIPGQQCMYWSVDHYEVIDCNQKYKIKVPVVQADLHALNNFKRIMTPDTLTNHALGRVWYVKKEGKPEFYTDSGYHPVDQDKKLLPVTTYILNKYTSYYRYLLNLFILWGSIAFISTVLIVISISYVVKAKKKQIMRPVQNSL